MPDGGSTGREAPATGAPKPEPKPDQPFDERVLSFARAALVGIAFLGLLGAVFYVWSGWHGDEAPKQVFEFVKVGLLPLAVMILTYYFAKPGGAGRGERRQGSGDPGTRAGHADDKPEEVADG